MPTGLDTTGEGEIRGHAASPDTDAHAACVAKLHNLKGYNTGITRPGGIPSGKGSIRSRGADLTTTQRVPRTWIVHILMPLLKHPSQYSISMVTHLFRLGALSR